MLQFYLYKKIGWSKSKFLWPILLGLFLVLPLVRVASSSFLHANPMWVNPDPQTFVLGLPNLFTRMLLLLYRKSFGRCFSLFSHLFGCFCCLCFAPNSVHIPGVPCCFSLSPICPDGLHRVPAEKVFEAQKAAPNIVSEGVIGTLVIDHD